MKRLGLLLLGLIIGIILGWALGFLRIPLVEYEYTFWVGFVFALTIVILTQMLLSLKRKKRQFDAIQKSGFLSHLIIGILLALSGWFCSQYFIQEKAKNFSKEQKYLLQKQEILVQSIQKEAYASQLGNLLNRIDEELNHPNSDTLSQTLINRIATVCFGLKPYRYIVGDSLSKFLLSPERGQLFLTLCSMNIDSLSFAKIKRTADFSMADLSDADLTGTDLSFAKLEKASFSNAHLNQTKWNQTNLYQANLWGAQLNQAHFFKTRLVRANLEWAELNETVLDSSFMNGVKLNNSKLNKATLQGTSMRWAELKGAKFDEASLTDTDLAHTHLTNTSFHLANLHDVNLRLVKLDKTNFSQVKFVRAIVEENWFEELKSSNSIGFKDIFEHYSLMAGRSNKYERAKYFLVKKKSH